MHVYVAVSYAPSDLATWVSKSGSRKCNRNYAEKGGGHRRHFPQPWRLKPKTPCFSVEWTPSHGGYVTGATPRGCAHGYIFSLAPAYYLYIYRHPTASSYLSFEAHGFGMRKVLYSL